MADVIKTTFKVKRGTAARWEELNPILNPGEPGFEMDTFKLKIGNGSTPWKELPYVNDVDIATSVQSDWNQNDETKPDYVKNRPFYTGDPVETVLVEESTVSFTDNGGGLYAAAFESTFVPTVGETYKVSWDGATYECICVDFRGMSTIGNLSIMGAGSDTGEPFFAVVNNGVGIDIGTKDTSSSHTISISGLVREVVKIDPKYIRDMYYTANPVETVLVEESTVPFSFSEGEGVYIAQFPSAFEATVGETYKVSWDGDAYQCTCVNFIDNIAIGNLSIVGAGSDTGEPFLVVVDNIDGNAIATTDTSASHTFSINGFVTEVVKIDEKYLPDTVATKADVKTAQSTADKAQYTANTAKTTANTAKTTAENAQTTAENAQTTANTALERTVEPYMRNLPMAPLYKNGGFSDWREVVQEISYNETEGYFFNEFDTTALKMEDMPPSVFCAKVYVGNKMAMAFLSPIVITDGNRWSVIGFAVITDKYFRTGEVLYVSANTISQNEAKGLFLTFRAPDSMLLKSSTTDSTKQFRITVDDSGALTATEIT